MKYIYKGHIAGVTLKLDEKTEKEVLFYDGKDYDDLPEDHDYIKTLIARGHLVPVSKKQSNADSNNKKGDNKNDG